MNKNMKKKLLLASLLGGSLLSTGCVGNQKVFDGGHTFDKAIIYNNDEALIVDVETYTICGDGQQIQVELKDGTVLVSSTFNTILVDGDGLSANDIAVSLVGEDGNVYYYNSETKSEKILVNEK